MCSYHSYEQQTHPIVEIVEFYLEHGHTHSANHDVVFQWSICHSVLKSSSGRGFESQGNYGVKELIEPLVSLYREY